MWSFVLTKNISSGLVGDNIFQQFAMNIYNALRFTNSYITHCTKSNIRKNKELKELQLLSYCISFSETHTDRLVINNKVCGVFVVKKSSNAIFDSWQREAAIFWEIWMLWIVTLTCQWFYSQEWSSSGISEGCNGLMCL